MRSDLLNISVHGHSDQDCIPTIIYVHPASGYEAEAGRFVGSVAACPPGVMCRYVIAVNGGKVTGTMRMLFAALGEVEYYEHDNTGWDIGAYQAVARWIDPGAWVCCMGASAYVKRGGWLRRLMHVAEGHGDGLYGTMASQVVRPHIRTTGFACKAGLLRVYDAPVRNRAERYAFEHGADSLTNRVLRLGLPVLLVTWSGEYRRGMWGHVPNGYRHGDQSECVTYDNHSDLHAA